MFSGFSGEIKTGLTPYFRDGEEKVSEESHSCFESAISNSDSESSSVSSDSPETVEQADKVDAGALNSVRPKTSEPCKFMT